MTTQDQALEAEIQAKGANVAPRVTPADIEANIVSEHYFTATDGVVSATGSFPNGFGPSPLDLITICVLVTKNGTKLVGANEGPVSPENFDPELGRKYARQKAIDQLWPMLGYELRTKLAAP
ncbi:Gp49 family protein [Curvibacter sp. HBC61]|uniref:Gp49 family protein n=1 Tax=Curvibacter cyanobacteriorum TaxID=3026422 RepID=A0ABT5MV20_9BURK|nr:Gp49 family protein [Curvibacter sp. HBC61]MDD0837904.1 Gp49 family protein [Curvibacter sp. HBC61]